MIRSVRAAATNLREISQSADPRIIITTLSNGLSEVKSYRYILFMNKCIINMEIEGDPEHMIRLNDSNSSQSRRRSGF